MITRNLILMALLLGTLDAWATPDIKEGLWEIGVLVEVPDMPGQGSRIAQTECLTKEKLIPMQQQNGICTMTDSKIEGNTVSWNMNCQTPDGVITGNGELHYQAESFEGSAIIRMPSVPEALPMTTKLDGHYLGPCPQ